MTIQPLTHHEILGLVEPFARRGRHVDLAATDRALRRLRFRVVERPASGAGDGAAAGGNLDLPALREELELESLSAGRFRLTRRLVPAEGASASLAADGEVPADLLAQIDGIPAACGFVIGPGFRIALSHRLEDGARSPERLELAGGVVEVGGITVRLPAPTPHGIRTDVLIAAGPGDDIALPDDLLAVLGRDWAPLSRVPEGWKCTMRMRGREPERSRRAEASLATCARHLAQTLAEPPRRFHERLAAARWAVVLRRAMPVLVCLGLIGAAASVPYLHLAENSGLRMLIFNSPPLLMMLFFCMREIPRIELPPLPRVCAAPAWRSPGAIAGAEAEAGPGAGAGPGTAAGASGSAPT
jgi:hypothetical protein